MNSGPLEHEAASPYVINGRAELGPVIVGVTASERRAAHRAAREASSVRAEAARDERWAASFPAQREKTHRIRNAALYALALLVSWSLTGLLFQLASR